LLWNSCDAVLVGVACQYEDQLKLHFWVSFVVLWVVFMLLDFKDMKFVSMWVLVLVVSSIVHTRVVETNEDVKIAVFHSEGMRCVKTGSK